MSRPTLTVIILTYNEEVNLPYALDSVCGWADSVLVLDSGSTDNTVGIARDRGCRVEFHRFENFGDQRNAALALAGSLTEWIFFLDADEVIPGAVKLEIDVTLAGNPEFAGYYLKRRLIWRGRWISHGYYPVWILRLARANRVRCEARTVNEHLQVEGTTGKLQSDFVHNDRRGIGDWVAKHNNYASKEAEEAAKQTSTPEEMEGKLSGSQPERSRWLRTRVWNRLPPIARPFAYFGYRYVLRGGFLDGAAGLTFHFMHGLWYPMLIDLKYLELKARQTEAAGVQRTIAREVSTPAPRTDIG
jgi:glycosyltransferase involved in cell wall biosynthesis